MMIPEVRPEERANPTVRPGADLFVVLGISTAGSEACLRSRLGNQLRQRVHIEVSSQQPVSEAPGQPGSKIRLSDVREDRGY